MMMYAILWDKLLYYFIMLFLTVKLLLRVELYIVMYDDIYEQSGYLCQLI